MFTTVLTIKERLGKIIQLTPNLTAIMTAHEKKGLFTQLQNNRPL